MALEIFADAFRQSIIGIGCILPLQGLMDISPVGQELVLTILPISRFFGALCTVSQGSDMGATPF